VDALGNLIVRKGQKTGDGMRIMLSAHMDEIGLMATHIDENGFIRFIAIGGVRVLTCIGGRVRFLNGTQGLIGVERLESQDRVPCYGSPVHRCRRYSRDDCPVKVGDMAVFDRPFLDLGDRLVSKAMDDRISVAVQMEVLRRLESTPTKSTSFSACRKKSACAALQPPLWRRS
jgi:tetrahedral aminopeptidase